MVYVRLSVAVVIACALLFVPVRGVDASADETWIAVVADTHVGHGPATAATREVYLAIGSDPRFAAVLHAGDVTEVGTSAEYGEHAAAAELTGREILMTPGNHDTRWAGGKDLFREHAGHLNRSILIGQMRVLMLDSSLVGGTHGHVSQAALAWLDAELESVPESQPVMIVMHHPPGYDVQFMDNDSELLSRFIDRQAIIFCGHGHLGLHWQIDRADIIMVPAAMARQYYAVRVSTRSIDIYLHTVGQTPPQQPLFSVPIPADVTPTRTSGLIRTAVRPSAPDPHLRPSMRLSGQPSGPVDPGTDIVIRSRLSLPPGWDLTHVRWRINRGPWQQAGQAQGNEHHVRVTMPVHPGLHTIEVESRSAHALFGPFTARRRVSVTVSGPVTEEWTYYADDGIWSTPALSSRSAWFGTIGGQLVSVNLRDGSAARVIDIGSPVLSSPAVIGRLVVVGSEDGVVTAVRESTGEIAWQVKTGGSIRGGIAGDGHRAYVGSADGVLHAIDVNTGGVAWTYATSGMIVTRPAVADGLVAVGSWDGHLHVVSADAGMPVWKRQLGRPPYFAPGNGSPVFAAGRIIVTTPSDPVMGRLGVHALTASDGSVAWQSTRPSGYSTPAVTITQSRPIRPSGTIRTAVSVSRQSLQSATAYLSTLNGQLYAVDLLSGGELWSVSTGRAMYDSAPITAGDSVVAATVGGWVEAVDRQTGASRWSYRLGDTHIFATAVFDGRRIIVAALDGRLVALRPH